MPNYETLKNTYNEAAMTYYEDKYVDGGWGVNPWGDDESDACEEWKSDKKEGFIVALGCGSGQDIRMLDFPDPDKFVGFDISVSMLANALVKHPEYTYVVQDCSQPIDIKCDVLTSVFGTPNYIGAAKLLEHYEAMNAKHAFFVFYAPWYEDGVATDYYRPTVEELTEMFGKFNPKIKQIRDNYILVRW